MRYTESNASTLPRTMVICWCATVGRRTESACNFIAPKCYFVAMLLQCFFSLCMLVLAWIPSRSKHLGALASDFSFIPLGPVQTARLPPR
jgi:hypothetical protein